MATGIVERRPDNVGAEYVCHIIGSDGSELLFAYPTREKAEQKLPKLIKSWTERGR